MGSQIDDTWSNITLEEFKTYKSKFYLPDGSLEEIKSSLYLNSAMGNVSRVPTEE